MFHLHDRLKDVPVERLKRLSTLDSDARLELFRRRLGQICWRGIRLHRIITQHEELIRILQKGDPTIWESSVAQLQSQIREAKQLL